MPKKSVDKKFVVNNCGSCPFLSSGSVTNYCGRMPYEMARDGLPKHGVNSDWRAPIPAWCPLRLVNVVVCLGHCGATVKGKT